MTEAKHTPGPWHYDWTQKVNGVIQSYAVGPARRPLDEIDHIDTIVEVDNDTNNAEANARLIAAAPELLEALEQSLDWTVDFIESGDAGFWDVDKDENVIRMRSAIAKAKGETA